MYDEIFDSVNGDPALRNNVIFTGFVDDEDMLPLMHSASAFAYISLYEGFGIPVIEGMASGVPTVTSYGSSLEEVAGGCCFLCEPKSADSVAEALSSALDIAQKAKSGDPAAREFIKAARDRASFFTWNACARETVKSYEMAREKRK
jgi:glycosyltransferase involved in cell wall biosynthesis